MTEPLSKPFLERELAKLTARIRTLESLAGTNAPGASTDGSIPTSASGAAYFPAGFSAGHSAPLAGADPTGLTPKSPDSVNFPTGPAVALSSQYQSLRADISWLPNLDDGGYGIRDVHKYLLAIEQDGGPVKHHHVQVVGDPTQAVVHRIAGLQLGSSYAASVAAVTKLHGLGPWLGPTMFTAANPGAPADTPTLLVSVDAAPAAPGTPTLVWWDPQFLDVTWPPNVEPDVANGQGYYEAVIRNNNTSTPPQPGTWDRFTSHAGITFAMTDSYPTTWYAKVRAIDAAGNVGPWSTEGSLTLPDPTFPAFLRRWPPKIAWPGSTAWNGTANVVGLPNALGLTWDINLDPGSIDLPVYEVYCSTSNGFTASKATYCGSTFGNTFVIFVLPGTGTRPVTGTTYYVKVLARNSYDQRKYWGLGVIGLTDPSVTFTDQSSGVPL